MPGVQILFAFLLTVPFTQRFGDVTDFQRDVYLVALVAAGVASALLIAPTAYHRLTFRRGHKRHLVFTANRWTIAGALASNGLFGPNGNENVPLLTIRCVRSKPSGPRFRLLFRSVLKTRPPSSLESPRDLLHVYANWAANPLDRRLLNSNCME